MESRKKIEFQQLVIQLCTRKQKVEAFLKNLKELNLDLGELQNDLKALETQKAKGKYTICETDDPCDLLLVGTEIQGSCMRVAGSARQNKCLVSYIMHGDTRVIAVKNDKGALIARSILRLMWDDDNETPVLLQERLYSNVNDPIVKKEINKWAIEKAKTMNLSLVSKEIGMGKPYAGKVQFLGGFAPFIYSDACGGVMNGLSEFQVAGCYTLYGGR